MQKDSTDPPARVTITDDQHFEYDIDPRTTKNITQKRGFSFSKRQLQLDKSGGIKKSDKSLIKVMSTNRLSQKKSGGLVKIRGTLASGFGQLAVMAIENIKTKGIDRPLLG